MNPSLNNSLHLTATPATLADVATALTALEHACDFLVGLSPQERIRLRPFGPSNEAFVPDIIEAGRRNAALVPPDLSAEEIALRREATVSLTNLRLRLETLGGKMDDTARLTGDGCVGLSLDLYHVLKRLGRSRGLDATVARIQRRFTYRKPAATSTQEPAAGAAGNVVALPAAPTSEAHAA